MNFLGRIYDRYPSALERNRAGFFYTTLSILIVLYLVFLIFIPSYTSPSGEVVTAFSLIAVRQDILIANFIFIIQVIAAFALAINGRLDTANYIVPAMVYVIIAFPNLINGTSFEAASGTFMLLIAIAGLFGGLKSLFFYTALTLVTMLLNYTGSAFDLITNYIIFFGMAIAIYQYLRYNTIYQQFGEFLGAEDRVRLAEITAMVSRQAAQRIPLQQILDTTLTELLKDYPAYYHAQVFLTDNKNLYSILTASTGEVGKKLLENAHQIPVGSISIIGQATMNGSPTMGYAGSPDTIHKENPLLPNTKLEVAFPMLIENRIVGALDLQSTSALSLSEQDITTFQAIANSLALAIDSAHQFTEAQERAQENQRLAEQSRNALSEVQRLNQRLISRNWDEFMPSEKPSMGFDADFIDNDIQKAEEWNEISHQAVLNNQVILEGHSVAIPIRVSGQAVGAIEFDVDTDTIDQIDLDMLEEVGSRLGLAIENMRLLINTQRASSREARMNEISTRLQERNDVESTLTETARGLQDILNAQNVSIRLKVEQG